MHNLMRLIVSRESNKKELLDSLNQFTRLPIHSSDDVQHTATCTTATTTKTSDYTLDELFCCLRISLFHETGEVRAAGLRAMRYLLKEESAVESLKLIGLPLLIVRSIDIVLENRLERIQALRLVRKLAAISPHLFPLAFTRALVAIVQDGLAKRDILHRASCAILAELTIMYPRATTVLTENCAFNAIMDAILSGVHPHSICESLVATLLYMLNWPEYRDLIRGKVIVEIFVAPFTDSHYTEPISKDTSNQHPKQLPQHTTRFDYTDSLDYRESKFTAAKNTLLSIARSWPGLIFLCDQAPEQQQVQQLQYQTQQQQSQHDVQISNKSPLDNIEPHSDTTSEKDSSNANKPQATSRKSPHVREHLESSQNMTDHDRDINLVSHSCLKSLINMLYLPYPEIRRRLIDFMTELFYLDMPSCSNDFEQALRSMERPRHSHDASKINDDRFIIEEAKTLLKPPKSRPRLNLVTEYMALILLAIIKCNVVDALSSVIIAPCSSENSVRATILLGQLMNLTTQYLPSNCVKTFLTLPSLFAAATSNAEEQRDLSNAALTNLHKIHELFKMQQKPTCSIFLHHIVQTCNPTIIAQQATSSRSSSMSSNSSAVTLSSLSSSIAPVERTHLSTGNSQGNPVNFSISADSTQNNNYATTATPSGSSYQASNNSTHGGSRRGRQKHTSGSTYGPDTQLMSSSSTSTFTQKLLNSSFTSKFKFPYLRNDKSDKAFQTLVKSMKLSAEDAPTDGWVDWDWQLIGYTLNRPSESFKKISSPQQRAFLKRLVHFYRPSTRQYSSIESNDHRAAQFCTIACQLIDFLLDSDDSKANELLESLMLDIAQSLRRMLARDDRSLLPKELSFSASQLISTLSSTYFIFIGRLSGTPEGYMLLERTKIIGLINDIIDLSISTSNFPALTEVHAKLIITCMNYANDFNGARRLMEKFLFEHPEENIRIYATNFLRVFFRAGMSDFSRWAIELLVRQLASKCKVSHRAALDTLDEVCDIDENLEGLISLKEILFTSDPAKNVDNEQENPSESMISQGLMFRLTSYGATRKDVISILRQSGDSGILLLCRFASSPNGLRMLLETPHENFFTSKDSQLYQSPPPSTKLSNETSNSTDSQHTPKAMSEFDHELNRWQIQFNLRYVKLAEDVLNTFTYHQKGEDGKYGRRVDKINPLTKNTYLPPHLYGQLAQHPDGIKILLARNLMDPVYEIIQNPPSDLNHSAKSVIEFKAALWIIGHVGSSEEGSQLIDEMDMLPLIVSIAKTSPVLAIRGTAYYVLGLLSLTEEGSEQLRENGWASQKDYALALPLDLDLILACPKDDQPLRSTSSYINAADATVNDQNSSNLEKMSIANSTHSSQPIGHDKYSEKSPPDHLSETTDSSDSENDEHHGLPVDAIDDQDDCFELHNSTNCLMCSTLGPYRKSAMLEKLQRDYPSPALREIRRNILNSISRLGEAINQRSPEDSLLNLKSKNYLVFQYDLCLYSEVSLLLATYNYRLTARRFLQELFLDISLDPFQHQAEQIVKSKPSLDSVDENSAISKIGSSSQLKQQQKS